MNTLAFSWKASVSSIITTFPFPQPPCGFIKDSGCGSRAGLKRSRLLDAMVLTWPRQRNRHRRHLPCFCRREE